MKDFMAQTIQEMSIQTIDIASFVTSATNTTLVGEGIVLKLDEYFISCWLTRLLKLVNMVEETTTLFQRLLRLNITFILPNEYTSEA